MSQEPVAAEPRRALPNTAEHPIIDLVAWRPEEAAERVSPTILMSRSTSNSYLVTTADGDVVINTGTTYQGQRHRQRYEELLGRPLDVRLIIVTQSHPDHLGGWGAFAGDGVETIAQAETPRIRHERELLKDFFAARSRRIVGGMNPSPDHLKSWFHGTADPEFTRMVDRRLEVEVGGRTFELIAAPGGETVDGIVVWLPDELAVFTGNLLGAIHGALPHLSTPRGDRQRSAPQVIRDIDAVLALGPELLITGHGEPIAGARQIRSDLGRVRDAVSYIHDATVAGMAAGTDLWTLMATIALPDELQPVAGRGPVRWYVRAVWEEYTGWFRHESTTELYAVPPSAVFADLLDLTGGPDPLAARAAEHAAAGRPLHAIYLCEIALSADPSHRASRAAQITALEQLVRENDGQAYDELAWLEGELVRAHDALLDP